MKKLLYIDLFCGAGGTSTGVNTARLHGEQCAEVIACVNHDANAIASHAANHPDALHFTEDIRTLELSPLVHHLQKCRTKNPDALVVLWASLECTNFSRAKGGQPRDADSRTLAEHLFRYIEAIAPDYIQIEDVEEFMSWGELDENGKVIGLKGDSGRGEEIRLQLHASHTERSILRRIHIAQTLLRHLCEEWSAGCVPETDTLQDRCSKFVRHNAEVEASA